MNKQMKVGISLPKILCRWWLRIRPCKNGVQLSGADIRCDGITIIQMPACIESYVPWWAWPLELIHRSIFGHAKLTATKVDNV